MLFIGSFIRYNVLTFSSLSNILVHVMLQLRTFYQQYSFGAYFFSMATVHSNLTSPVSDATIMRSLKAIFKNDSWVRGTFCQNTCEGYLSSFIRIWIMDDLDQLGA
jgi:hypothetical protein